MSSQSQHVFLTADELTSLSELEFTLAQTTIAVGATHLYTVGVKADVSAPIVFR